MKDLFYQNYKEGKLDKQVMSFLSQLSQTESIPLRLQKPEEVRINSSILSWTQMRDEPYKVNNVSIKANDTNISVRIYEPKGIGPHPVLIYFHGGGFVFGSLDEADHICSSLSNEIPAIVVSVDYHLSPEKKYPKAIEDAYDVVLWIEKEIEKYNGNPKLIGVAGESAGANIATVLCQMLRDKNHQLISYQLLINPWVDLYNIYTNSYSLFGDGIWLSKASIEYYRDQYLQYPEQAKDNYVSPLLSNDLCNLPPAHIIISEFDVLRDEGKMYADRLQEAGNRVTYKQYKGMIHSFIVLNKVIDMANAAIDDCIDILRKNLLL